MELRPLNQSHTELLNSLQLQDDVWESIGTLPLPEERQSHHLFAVMEGPVPLGFAGLLQSHATEANDFELVCAMRAEVQTRGMAKQACQLALDWAFNTAKLERVIACIDDSNDAARAIAGKLGMTTLGPQRPNRTVYVKYRTERRVG
ncbi:MAG TPA: GNAT family N-acetyltransferase [Gemmatimonadales bacterium]|nr:GNAT family N-acetyltransferase [Gemmatimonadales bacterium]